MKAMAKEKMMAIRYAPLAVLACAPVMDRAAKNTNSSKSARTDQANKPLSDPTATMR
jgi:hypothetical protein